MPRRQVLFSVLLCASVSVASPDSAPGKLFSDEQRQVARFWQQMGPTLREQGFDAYAERYHENFSHWTLNRGGATSDKTMAMKAWRKFYDAGHRITCSYVEPVSVNLYGNLAFARLEYEQTTEYADGREELTVWRMASLFKQEGERWSALESNMMQVDIDDYREKTTRHRPDGCLEKLNSGSKP